MRVNVLLYSAGTDDEGIHSLELNGETVVLMFENPDDAERYAGLLEAQDFPVPSVEALDQEEIESFCIEAGYISKFIESGFIPKTDQERMLIAPPEHNLDVNDWNNDDKYNEARSEQTDNLEAIRKRLEGLI